MTRYLCVHPAHRRHGEIAPVDVTAQVRSERAMWPRPSAYLAITEDTLSRVGAMQGASPEERSMNIARILSGVREPENLPVVLMSRQSVSRPPGLYEMDELRSSQPAVERVATRVGASHIATGLGEDLLILENEQDTPTIGGAGSAPTAVVTRPSQATRIIPQGVFGLWELTAHLSVAEPTEAGLIDAIRSTPSYDSRAALVTAPWRVVVTCPKTEGAPATSHQTLFTGPAAPEAAISYGTPADGWDETVEVSAEEHLAPAAEVARVEHRVWALISAEMLVLGTLLALGWASGALRFASRETPWWLGLSLVLAVGSIAFAAIPMFAVREPAANMNDVFVVETLFDSRLTMLRWAAAGSAVLFGLALMSGIIPPLSASGGSVPAATVTFDTSSQPFTTTVRVNAADVGAGDSVNVTMREYRVNDQVGTLVGDVTRGGNASGEVLIAETLALDPQARYMSVLVTTDSSGVRAPCNPSATGAPGCVVLAVPVPSQAFAGQLSFLAPSVLTSAVPVVSSGP